MNDFIKKAKFISADPSWGKICPKFKKEFIVDSEVKSAELQISALGVYDAFLNGERLGDAVLTPGWTEYECRVQYLTYNITHLIKENNTLTVGLGHGWYASRLGSPDNYKGAYAEYPAFIAAIKICYTDGETALICTDESWRSAKSEVLFSTIYDGEKTDARVVPVYDGKVYIYDYDVNKLTPFEGEYVRETERISPKEIIVTPKGEKVIDFGQNLTGYLEFRITGKAGDKVSVRHAEVLDREGNFYNANYRSAEALIEYTLKDGTQKYKAHYTFYGFRYVKLEGWTEEIKPENFTAVVIHSDMKRTGWFECGVPKVNKLYENIIWGQRGNFVDIPTDCPQRDERLGWTGDAEVFCRTASLNYDTEKFFIKWLHDLSLAQKENGMVPRVVPDVFRTPKEMGSSAWGDAATVCPYEVYMAFGNKKVLSDSFESMKKWVDFIYSMPGGYLWKDSPHFGDWLGMDAPEGSYKGSTSEELIATAYFYLSCGLLIKTGKILGHDVSYYEDMHKNIRAAFNQAYVRDGRLVSDTQTAYVIAIHFGLVDDKQKFGKRLIELIENFGDRLQTGFVGTPYLLDTLTEIGRTDKAYTLLLQEKFPSWLFSVNQGATTIWEHWDGMKADGTFWSTDMNSFNHYAYGSVAAWMYRTAAGIRYDENCPAYKHFFIEPKPDKRLGYVRCRLDTRAGTVVSEWTCEGDGSVRYCFTVPENTTATVTVGGKTEVLSPGRYTRYGRVYPAE